MSIGILYSISFLPELRLGLVVLRADSGEGYIRHVRHPWKKKEQDLRELFGRYEYTDVPAEAFPKGLTYLENMGYTVKVATKEKTICDSLCKWRVVRNIKELKELLFEDKRIDEDEFAACDFKLMKRLAGLYAKTNLKVLIKPIGNEYENEQHS